MAETLPADSIAPPRTSAQLEVVVAASPDPARVGHIIPLQGPALVLGRSDEADLPFCDDRMSRRHAVFREGAVHDLGSRNGVFVDGQPTRQIALGPGSVVRLGDTLMVVRPEEGSGSHESPGITGSRMEARAFLGTSRGAVRTRAELQRAGPTGLTVLLLGETGTGKELCAQELHRLSPGGGPFVAINCAAISETLAESTLFGHVRGAFTGATSSREGCFAAADGGTLLLDEIGELSPVIQAKLLRVLEDGQIQPLGAAREHKVDVRVIAATNRDLSAASEEGTFRTDLLARLSEWVIHLPPLSERREDIPLLIEHFLEQGLRVATDALEALMVADHAFNVRGLSRLARRLVHTAEGKSVQLEELGAPFSDGLRARRHGSSPETTPPPEERAELTRELIEEALTLLEGNVARAARHLGYARRTVYRRIQQLGIEPDRFR